MSIFARIADGRVAEPPVTADDAPFAFPGTIWVTADDAVREGWIYANGTFSEPPAHEQTKDDVRTMRGAMLAACDWTQAADAPFTAEQAQSWRTYRQALRDVPSQTMPVTWPVRP